MRELFIYFAFQIGFLFVKIMGMNTLKWWMVFIPFYLFMLWFIISVIWFLKFNNRSIT